MSVVGISDIIIPSNDQDRKALQSELQAICDNLTMIEGIKGKNKDIVENAAETFAMKKEDINKLAVLHYKRNKDEVLAKAEAIVEAYEQLFKGV